MLPGCQSARENGCATCTHDKFLWKTAVAMIALANFPVQHIHSLFGISLYNNLSIDYTHYITNQIMKPLLQVFALDNIMKNIPKLNRLKMNGLKRKIKRLEGTLEEEKYKKKADSMREKFVKELIFDSSLKKIKNAESMKAKKKFISSFF